MKITKDIVLDALSNITLPNQGKSLVASKVIKNLQIFGADIELDLEIDNPALQYKKRVELECKRIINAKISGDLKVKINFIVKAKQKDPVVIKGESIPGVKNIIAVSSGKGGVGKSTIAANLSVGLSALGYKVGIIDADIYGPSIHIMFGLEGAVPKAINTGDKSKIKPLENYGVKLMSIGFFAKSQQAVVWRGPMASKALNQLLWDTYWGDLDYLVVDLPPGTGDIHLSLVQSIPLTGAIVVSTPQDIALADAKKGVNMFQMSSIKVPVLGLIENMSYFTPPDQPDKKYYIFGKDGAKNLANQLDIDLLAEIPIVQSVREAADAGRPAVLQQSTLVAVKYLNMASKVVDLIAKRNVNLPPTNIVETNNKIGCSK